MLRVCEKLRATDTKINRLGLVRTETDYLRDLLDAMANMDRYVEVEVVKTLGDVNLEKGRLDKNPKKLDRAMILYRTALLRCKDADVGESLEHRYHYAEKLRLGKQATALSSYEPLSNNIRISSLVKVVEKFQQLDRRLTVRSNTESLLIEYTKLVLEGIVNGDNALEVEAIKSLGDVYLKRGTETNDTTCLTKATALYNTALARCERFQGTVALIHRLLYTARIRQKKKTGKKVDLYSPATCLKLPHHGTEEFQDRTCNERLQGGCRALQAGDPDTAEHLQEGCRSLQRGDLDTAEQNFAAALKSVHGKDSSKEVEPLLKLSNVYLKRGMQSKDGDDFTKAAALCNAALVRSKSKDQGDIKQTIQFITQSFVKNVLGITQTVGLDDVDKHKTTLKDDRHQVAKEIKEIEQKADPYSLDDDDPNITEVEKRRVEAIKVLLQTILHQRRLFITGLINECMEVMGPPPCKYAMIGLGSQATGLVTPYSDLEFAILIEKETVSNVTYFRNLTHYLHLKVINLGETILPAMGIKSLNDFHSNNSLENWYYDSVTPRGFSFDGAMPHACKTPLGRGKTCELIRTPSNMVKLLEDNVTFYLKKGYHLVSVLGNVSLIVGEQELIDGYTSLWIKLQREDKRKIPMLLANAIMTENSPTFERHVLDASLHNVKKEIYRFSSIVVLCWALLHEIQPTTIWETIAKMHKNGVVNEENAHHLMVMVSISAELRLRTYMNNHGQVENMSALSSMQTETDVGETLRKVFYISNAKQLMRYYYTATPLKRFVSKMIESPGDALKLFDNSLQLKSQVYDSLCDYPNSKVCLERNLQEYHSLFGEAFIHPDIAKTLCELGVACQNIGDHNKAVSYHEQSLQMSLTIYGENTAHPDIAMALNNLGVAWMNLGDHKKAVSYHQQSLHKKRTIYGETTAHPYIASSLNNLGNACMNLGDHKKAVSYHEQSLQMGRTIYGENTAHTDIASSLNNLGKVWMDLGDYNNAVSYYEQSLQMRRAIYGENTAHTDIAKSLNNLGNAWMNLGDCKKAASYHEQSLQMMRTIYGENRAHPDIASSLNNLGVAWIDLGDHKKAVSYHEKSLQMMRTIYGENNAHPDIATSLGNLGVAWMILGDYKKAVSYHEQSLQMMRTIYGETTAHPDIASSQFGERLAELR